MLRSSNNLHMYTTEDQSWNSEKNPAIFETLPYLEGRTKALKL